ncbi:MAG TPA: hypothetical protein VGK00_13410 [Anaerolineales bacterium]
MNEKKGFWYLLSGLVLGLGMGLLVSWVLAPVEFVDTTPASLRTDFKDEYRFLIASAYAADNDLPRAQARLGTLGNSNPVKALGEQSQRMLGNGVPMADVQLLADLSTDLQSQPTEAPSATVDATANSFATPTNLPTATASNTPTVTPEVPATPSEAPTSEETATPTPRPISTLAARPSAAPSPTPASPFKLAKRATFCEPDQQGLLRVYLSDPAGKPVAGVELVITWLNGEDHFFTGLKPELGYGYADYQMTKNVEYALSIPGGGAQVSGLNTPNCPIQQGGSFPGGIRLDFKQP